MPESSPLIQFREAIDAIDDQLIQLLKERCEIVGRVGQYKRALKEERHFIRPGREGDMLRRIYREFKGSVFHPAMAVAIWRQIIATSTGIETPMSLHVLGEPLDPYSWHARIYFGRFHPMTHYSAPEPLFAALSEDTQAVGILPRMDVEGVARWWPALLPYAGKLNVFAHLPFVHTDGVLPPALAVGQVTCEPSEKDITLVAEGEETLHLMNGFLSAESAEIRALGAQSPLTILGQYPAPQMMLEGLIPCMPPIPSRSAA